MLTTNTLKVAVVLLLLGGCSTRTTDNLNSNNHWSLQHRTKNLIVGVAITPATADHNTVFITLQNPKGEPISSAKVSISTVKQFMFSTKRDLQATYVAPGTYRINTNMEPGISEVNISIKPPDMPATKLRVEADIERTLESKKSYLLLQ